MKILKDRPKILAASALRSEDVKAVRQLTGLDDANAVNVLLQTEISGHNIQAFQHNRAPITRKAAVKLLVEQSQ